MKTNRITKIGLLGAVALVIFVAESFIPAPIPIPGAKIGLSNIVILYSIMDMNAFDALMVLLIKIFLGNMITGQGVSLVYSLSGGIACFTFMYILKRYVGEKQIWFVSVIGAIAHSIGQIMAAYLIIKSSSIFYYLPALIAISVACGAFTGLACQYFYIRIKKIKRTP